MKTGFIKFYENGKHIYDSTIFNEKSLLELKKELIKEGNIEGTDFEIVMLEV